MPLRFGAACLLLMTGLVPAFLHTSQHKDGTPTVPVQRFPQIVSVFPMGAEPGTLTDVEVRGEFLDGALRVVFTDTAFSARVQRSSFTRVELQIQVPARADPGPRYFRLITPRGASNLLLFRVSRWASIQEKEPNNDLESPQPVQWPAMVSGRLATPRDVDLFRINLKAGQRLNLNLLAARNWSSADLSLALLTPDGRAIRQDEGRFIWDPCIEFTCSKDGDYLAAVMLTRMPAGGQSSTHLVYQLAIGDLPILLSAWPPYARSGDPVNIEVRGEFLGSGGTWALAGSSLETARDSQQNGGAAILRLFGKVDRDTAPGMYPLGLLHPSGAAAPLMLRVGEYPTRAEKEPNDDVSTAEPLEIPMTVNGRIQSNADEDVYSFDAQANESLVFDVDAEKLGSRLDARLVLTDAGGKMLSANDDAKSGEGALDWDPKLEYTFKEPGKYFIRIYSLQRRGGADYVYALTARRRSPDFSLSVAVEKLVVPRGDKAAWTVNVQRREGYKGDIVVGIARLPEGVQAKPLTIKAEETSGRLEPEAAPQAPLTATVVNVEGRGVVDGKERCRAASVPAARIVAGGPGFSPYRSTDAWISVVEPALFSLEPAASEIFLVRGGRAEFGVKIARSKGFDADPEFSLENLPEGITLEKVEMVDQGRVARLTLRASEHAPVGRVPDVTIIATAAKRSESAPRISLQVD